MVLAIKDIESEKSGVSLSVGVGSLHEPKEWNGLAHFLEHMLFLGSEKYKEGSEYNKYLSENGGYSNAYTSEMETNYYLEVNHKGLEGALDRFSQFFISPLMTEELTTKEMNAVHSEHSKNILNDSWRQNRIIKLMADPNSQFSRFSTGNMDTLNKPDIRKELLRFYEDYYSSDIMKECGILMEKVKGYFSGIRNKGMRSKRSCEFVVDPYGVGYREQFVQIQSVAEKYKLVLMFQLERIGEKREEKGSEYVSHLLGHEGSKSLYSVLRDEGYVENISAGGSDRMDRVHLFSINITLTHKGYINYHTVILLTFQYLNLLKHKGVQQQIWQELAKITHLHFQFQNKQSPSQIVIHLSSAMHSLQNNQLHHILYLPYAYSKFDSTYLTNLISQFNLSNLNILLSSNQPTTQHQEPFYNINYSHSYIDSQLKSLILNASLNDKLDLPSPNQFIAENVDLVENSGQQDEFNKDEFGVSCYKDEFSEVFYYKDDRFRVPKGSIYIKVWSEFEIQIGSESEIEILKQVWGEVFSESINETTYMASLAGLSSSLSLTQDGIILQFQGISHKLPLLVHHYLSHIFIHQSPLHSLIHNKIAKIQRNYNNFIKNQTYQIAIHYLGSLINQHSNSISQLKSAAHNFTIQKYTSLAQQLFTNLRYRLFVSGNFKDEYALELQQQIEQSISSIKKLNKDQLKRNGCIQLKENIKQYFEYIHEDKQQQNSCIIKCFQMKEGNNLKTNMKLQMLIQMFKSEAFERLRTIEQLGYIVFTTNYSVKGVQNLLLIVQSNVKCPHYLAQRIEVFLSEHFDKEIQSISDDKFRNFKDSLISQYKQKDYTIYEESDRIWTEIVNSQYVYDRKQQYIQILNDMNKSELIQFIKSTLFDNSAQLEVHVVADQHISEQAQFLVSRSNLYHITDIQSFKQQSSYFPNYQELK